MAKLRVFISSTYYDLRHIRTSLENFITGMGYEPILFEEGDIPFRHDEPLDISCYEEIKNVNILVLIIGGRYGSQTSDDEKAINDKIEFYNSITKKEYETAKDEDIPIYVFIEKPVLSEYHTYKKNRSNDSIEYAHVDNINIFRLIDEIYSQKRNNLVKDFEKFDDISHWLKEQWAGLFADFLSKQNEESRFSDLSSQISDLREVSGVLREYSESIMRKIEPEDFENIIDLQHKKLRNKKIDRFIKFPMIRWLLKRSPSGVGKATLYNAFISSNDVIDFLEKAKFPSEIIKEIMDAHGIPAERDFTKIKEKL